MAKTKWNMKMGFTLVELLVVMSIILILVGIALPALYSARMKARDAEVKAGVNEINKALASFGVDHNGFFPGMNWMFDSQGALYNGPGLRGGTPIGATQDEQRYAVPDMSMTQRYLADGVTPDPERVDVLSRDGYLTSYPANPFLRVGGAAERQMTNLFYFGCSEDDGPDMADTNYVQWCYTAYDVSSTMRIEYDKYGRGHFTYIPLNPVNSQGIDFTNWDNLTLNQRAEYYKFVRSYVIVGWGYTRGNDTLAKGLSVKWWDSAENGFDMDGSMTIDPIESNIIGIIRPHMQDSAGSFGTFGQVDITGHANIDAGFDGAVIILSSEN
jgi:prepilin-type N-terminal cleavage/methylation domain-containing protein